MLHAAVTFVVRRNGHAMIRWICNVKTATLNCLWRNNRSMIRWICNVKAKDEVSSDSLLSKLDIQDSDVVLGTSRMRWFGHIERSRGWIAEVRKLNVQSVQKETQTLHSVQ